MKDVTKTRNVGTRTIVISAVGLVLASAVVAVVMLTSRPTSSAQTSQSLPSSSGTSDPAHGSGDMPGMAPDPSHGSDDMPAATPDPAHGSGDGTPTGPAHGGTVEAAVDRPLVPVLGTFGGGASAVMLAAGLLRRRDRARNQTKAAARAARKAQS